MRLGIVVSSANLKMMLGLCLATHSCINREYRRELSMQPWGAPVLRVNREEILLSLFTTWGLLIWKFIM